MRCVIAAMRDTRRDEIREADIVMFYAQDGDGEELIVRNEYRWRYYYDVARYVTRDAFVVIRAPEEQASGSRRRATRYALRAARGVMAVLLIRVLRAQYARFMLRYVASDRLPRVANIYTSALLFAARQAFVDHCCLMMPRYYALRVDTRCCRYSARAMLRDHIGWLQAAFQLSASYYYNGFSSGFYHCGQPVSLVFLLLSLLYISYL